MAETQNLAERLTAKVNKAAKRLEERYFEQWKDCTELGDREAIYSKLQVLTDLKFSLINSINNEES